MLDRARMAGSLNPAHELGDVGRLPKLSELWSLSLKQPSAGKATGGLNETQCISQ